MNRFECLKAAQATVEDREQRYGSPHAVHERIAKLWAGYGFTVDGSPPAATDIAIAMILVKIARLADATNFDSWVDVAGYAALGAELEETDGDRLRNQAF